MGHFHIGHQLASTRKKTFASFHSNCWKPIINGGAPGQVFYDLARSPAIFLAEIFFNVLGRSFAAIKGCLGKAWDIEIIQHLSSHPISFLQSINFAPCSSIWGLRLHSETLSYAFDHKLGNAAERGDLLTLHDVRTPWNFDILRNLFSLKKSQMDQFQPNLFNVWSEANVWFCLSSWGF